MSVGSLVTRGSNSDGPTLSIRKVFGHIPGVAIGTWWLTRQACSLDAVHA